MSPAFPSRYPVDAAGGLIAGDSLAALGIGVARGGATGDSDGNGFIDVRDYPPLMEPKHRYRRYRVYLHEVREYFSRATDTYSYFPVYLLPSQQRRVGRQSKGQLPRQNLKPYRFHGCRLSINTYCYFLGRLDTKR